MSPSSYFYPSSRKVLPSFFFKEKLQSRKKEKVSRDEKQVSFLLSLSGERSRISHRNDDARDGSSSSFGTISSRLYPSLLIFHNLQLFTFNGIMKRVLFNEVFLIYFLCAHSMGLFIPLLTAHLPIFFIFTASCFMQLRASLLISIPLLSSLFLLHLTLCFQSSEQGNESEHRFSWLLFMSAFCSSFNTTVMSLTRWIGKHFTLSCCCCSSPSR